MTSLITLLEGTTHTPSVSKSSASSASVAETSVVEGLASVLSAGEAALSDLSELGDSGSVFILSSGFTADAVPLSPSTSSTTEGTQFCADTDKSIGSSLLPPSLFLSLGAPEAPFLCAATN